jgi:hypothetical protein
MWGAKEKKIPKKKPTWAEERKRKGQLEFATLVSPRTWRDKNYTPSICIGALVGVGSLWPGYSFFPRNIL